MADLDFGAGLRTGAGGDDLDDLMIEGGDIRLVEGPRERMQRVKTALRTQRGELVLDRERGVPWVSILSLPKPQIEPALYAFLYSYVPTITGVGSVQDISIDIDKTTRRGVITIESVIDGAAETITITAV